MYFFIRTCRYFGFGLKYSRKCFGLGHIQDLFMPIASPPLNFHASVARYFVMLAMASGGQGKLACAIWFGLKILKVKVF